MNKAQEKEIFLRSEYEFLAKAYEIQFTHFMQVFYFWIAVIGTPTTIAGIFAEVDKLGYVCFGAGFLGSFLASKMFDIRFSQFRYIAKMNELRSRFWLKFDIEKSDKIEMLGKGADLGKIARTDFGINMAWVMSIVNSVLISVGILLLLPFISQFANIAIVGLIGILTLSINIYQYYRIVVWKLPKL